MNQVVLAGLFDLEQVKCKNLLVLDWDDTASVDPEMFKQFLDESESRGYFPICCTARSGEPSDIREIQGSLGKQLPIVFTSGSQKYNVLLSLFGDNESSRLLLDKAVWIDDNPISIPPHEEMMEEVDRIREQAMESDKILLEMTREQAESMLVASELLFRLSIGHTEHISELAKSGHIKKKSSTGEPTELDFDECEHIEDIALQLKGVLGHTASSHFGIHNSNVHVAGKRAYDTWKALSATLKGLSETPSCPASGDIVLPSARFSD